MKIVIYGGNRMKNIRSKSIAALSVMLLLSAPVAKSFEFAGSDEPSFDVVAPVKTGWVASAKGIGNTVAAKTASIWAARPSFAEAKDMVGNQATALYEAAKAHPYVAAATAAAIATPVVGYGIYKAFQGKQVDLKTLIAQEALKDATIIQTVTKKNSTKIAGQYKLGKNLAVLIYQLPAEEVALKNALEAFSIAIQAWDMNTAKPSEMDKKLVADVVSSMSKLKELGLFDSLPKSKSLKAKLAELIPSKAAIKKAASALVPSKATMKMAAFVGIPAAAIATGIAYDNGSLDNVITAGSNAATDLGKAIANIDYTGKFNAAKGFVANHPYAFGIPSAASVATGAIYLNRDTIKKATLARKQFQARQAKLETALKPVDVQEANLLEALKNAKPAYEVAAPKSK